MFTIPKKFIKNLCNAYIEYVRSEIEIMIKKFYDDEKRSMDKNTVNFKLGCLWLIIALLVGTSLSILYFQNINSTVSLKSKIVFILLSWIIFFTVFIYVFQKIPLYIINKMIKIKISIIENNRENKLSELKEAKDLYGVKHIEKPPSSKGGKNISKKLFYIYFSSIFVLLIYMITTIINKYFNPLKDLNFYEPIKIISWILITLILFGFPIYYNDGEKEKRKRIVGNIFRFFSFTILILGFIGLYCLYFEHKSIAEYKYNYFTSNFFKESEKTYYKTINPNSFIDYNRSKCNLITVEKQKNDMLGIKANFQIVTKDKKSKTKYKKLENSTNKKMLYCTYFEMKNVKKYFNEPLSLTFKATTEKIGKNKRFGILLLKHLFLFDSKDMYFFENVESISGRYVLLGDIENREKKGKLKISQYNHKMVTKFSSYDSEPMYSWGTNNKIDIIITSNMLVVKNNDFLIYEKKINKDFWKAKKKPYKIYLAIEKESDFALGLIQLAKLNPKTENDFFIKENMPFIKRIKYRINSSKVYGSSKVSTNLYTIDNNLKLSIPANEKISILSETNDLFYIQYNNNLGYCKKNDINSIYSHKFDSFTVFSGTIRGKQANIKSGPSTNHQVITKVKQGDSLSIKSKINDWYLVRIDDQEGYIHKNLVSVIALPETLKENPNQSLPDLQPFFYKIDSLNIDIKSISQKIKNWVKEKKNEWSKIFQS
ncbi:MAG: SH3 domain-containing protein [Candidatus Cloacimonetes bacterium]|nr:SH3 domain-containing protein [Candidatus Cloacimonadota bacterium]